MTEKISVPIKGSKLGQKKLISSKKPTKNKKLKGKKKLIDISNQITLEFKYEDFEEETESFFPQIYREESKITIDNVNLLDQSHLRFLINPNSDIINHYTSYKQKNFKNISWKDIELIYFYCNEDYKCPICLESKLCCPVISKCGHVFCYPCIISFLNYFKNLDDNKNNNKIPNCPLCKEKFKINSDEDCFKICQKIGNKSYNIDKNMKFNLILRDKKSQTLFNLIYDPVLSNWENNFRYKMRDIPEKNEKEFNFSRIFLANDEIMKKILNEYKSDLDQLKKEFDSTSDELRKISINQCINKIDYLLSNNKYEKKPKGENKTNLLKTFKKNINGENSSEESDDLKVDIDYRKYSLFYQEENGDIYYLDPLIMEILISEYGDYNSLPTEIEGKILDISMFQVTPEFKCKYKYLNHLRIGSIINFVEIDVNDLISSSTKKKFSEKLKERNRMRNLLKNQEKNYELFLSKKNSKISEDENNLELNSTSSDSKKSLGKNMGLLFFGTDEELGKNQNEKKDDNINIKNKMENKLALLFLEKEKEDKEKEVKEKNNKNKNNNINEKIMEKGGKNKKKNKKNKKGGNKGKKKNVKEMVFNSESCANFSESDY